MNYKLWLKTLFISFFSILIIFLYLIHDKYHNNDLNSKENLLKCHPDIIFAGDSRAERNLNVNHALKVLNKKECKIINIAISSGTPTMIEDLLNKYPTIFSKSKLIVSISPVHLNDNSKSINYFTRSMISKLTFFEQIKTFFPFDINTLLTHYSLNFQQLQIKDYLFKKENNNLSLSLKDKNFGFFGVDSAQAFNNIKTEDWYNSPFFINYKDGGIKYKIIENSLKNLKKGVKKLYVYSAPYDESIFNDKKGRKLYDFEISFKEKLQRICEENNITCKQYLHLEELDHSDFYDAAHLNVKGSKKFTTILLRDFGLVPMPDKNNIKRRKIK